MVRKKTGTDKERKQAQYPDLVQRSSQLHRFVHKNLQTLQCIHRPCNSMACMISSSSSALGQSTELNKWVAWVACSWQQFNSSKKCQIQAIPLQAHVQASNTSCIITYMPSAGKGREAQFPLPHMHGVECMPHNHKLPGAIYRQLHDTQHYYLSCTAAHAWCLICPGCHRCSLAYCTEP
jgi:hypothetical protein